MRFIYKRNYEPKDFILDLKTNDKINNLVKAYAILNKLNKELEAVKPKIEGSSILIFYERDIFKICKGQKIKTLRPLNIDLEIGQTVKCAVLYRKPFASVKIVNKTFIEDFTTLKAVEFKDLGYKTKKDYFKEPYNLKNGSKARILYEFELIEFDINGYIKSFK